MCAWRCFRIVAALSFADASLKLRGDPPAPSPVPIPAAVADFTALEDNFVEWANQFKSGDGIGDYSYNSRRRNHPTSLYGTTDMLISFFVLGLTGDMTESEKDSWAETINGFQDPATGIYSHEDWEHASSTEEHATAFAVAALTLINRSVAYPLANFLELQANESQWEPWITNPTTESTTRRRRRWDHRSSGTWAALSMTGTLNKNFSIFYFDWMRSQADPRSGGFVCPGKVTDPARKPELGWMTCFVHVLWQFDAAKETWAYPDAMVDMTLEMFNSSSGYFCRSPGSSNPSSECNKDPRSEGKASNVNPSCHQLDGVFTVARSSALLGGYRWEEVRQMCEIYLQTAAARLSNKTVLMDQVIYGDSHGLNGGLQSIAECKRWFPEMVKTRRTWRGSLDYASFM